MPQSVPSFVDVSEKFRADACSPLIGAAARRQLRLQVLSHGHYPGTALPSNVLPGLKMAGFWDAENEQDWGLNWHRNEGIEFTFLQSGSVGFAVDDCEYELHPEDLTVTRPWQEHKVGRPNVSASRLHWVIIDIGVRRPHQEWRWPSWILLSARDLGELTQLLRENEHPVWKSNTETRRCFQWIARAVELRSVSHLSVRLNELLLLILELLKGKHIGRDPKLTTASRTVQMFLNELRKSPENAAIDWGLEQMAAHCGLGATQFVHHVRALTNMAPMHYLNHCRLMVAADLLRENPELPVIEAAMTCGFCSSQYFATLFARKFKCTPTEYRRNTRRMAV